jgi:recombination protein RecA
MKRRQKMVKNTTGNNGSGDGKLKALEGAISQIEKRFGKGSIFRLGETNYQTTVEVIPSGSLSLDLALGAGGIPRGRATEIFGSESSGKTTLAYHVVAEAQKLGGTAVYIDVEHAVDLEYAARCGVKIKDLLISQPGCAEEALEITEAVVRSSAVDVVVIDSVAALAPRAEIEGEMGEAHMGLQARLMSQALRKLSAATGRSKTAVIFINQLRQTIGSTYGNPEITPGGRALKFYASVRIELKLGERIEEGSTTVGRSVKARVVKNKVAPPFREARFDIMFGEGISKEGELIDLGTGLGIIDKKGHWYQWGGNMLANGREAAKKFLKEHQEIGKEIENLIRRRITGTPQDAEAKSGPGSAVAIPGHMKDDHQGSNQVVGTVRLFGDESLDQN